jgi:magnesium transporter
VHCRGGHGELVADVTRARYDARMAILRAETHLQESLETIVRLLERHRVLEALAERHEGPRRELIEQLQRRQNLAELERHVRAMHAADVAHVLEALPIEDRRTTWDQLETDAAAAVLVELSDAVRDSIVDHMPRERLLEVLVRLDPEDLAYLASSLPADVLAEASRTLEAADRTILDESIRYPAGSVGHVMTREWVEIGESQTLGDALAQLRGLGSLPAQTDHIYVVDVRHVLRGTVPVQILLVSDPATPVVSAMRDEVPVFQALEEIGDVAKAFERYDLVSAPVVDERGKLVGRVTVEAVMDLLREEADLRALRSAGLSRDEDLFAAPWASARNRWPWLAINLVTAFVASRVIGQFETTIQHLAALAALMPIVASVGGNTGNQTMALVIRGLAIDQIPRSGVRPLLRKELVVSLMNGAVWGVLVGLFAVAIYFDVKLGLVMSGAVVLNLVVAAASGVLVPMALHRIGRDPAHGSSVLVTFMTDAMGFFLFLGLATWFLV